MFPSHLKDQIRFFPSFLATPFLGDNNKTPNESCAKQNRNLA